MKHITNLREARQLQCQGAEPCTVVSIAIGDLERIATVAEANLRDKFAMSAVQDCDGVPSHFVASRAYRIADEMLKVRNERTATS
jgi:hypothetical protein